MARPSPSAFLWRACCRRRLELINAADVKRIEAVVAAHALPVRLRAPLPLASLVEAMRRDKKARAGLPRFGVLNKNGSAVTHDNVSPVAH